MANNKADIPDPENGNEDRVQVLADLLSRMASGEHSLVPPGTGETLESKLEQLTDDELQQLCAAGRFVRTLDDICQSNLETHGYEETESRSVSENKLVSDRSEIRSDRIGKYAIVDLAGEGGFAKVYKAFDEDLQRFVALKVPHADKLNSPRLRERFRREGRAAALLTHDGIVSAYEAGSQDGLEYICYAWIDGTDLGSWLESRKANRESPHESNHKSSSNAALPFEEVTAAMQHLADAMGHAHARQILHRDIKPANILVENLECRPWYKSLRVADFGLVRDLDAMAKLTHDGEVMGTPAYMSPEQVRCDSTLGPPSDVYALGSLMYELLTGDPPHLRTNYASTLLAIENESVTSINSHRPNVPRDLQAICMKCLEFEPAKRYANASELHLDLVHFNDGIPVSARSVGLTGRFARWSKRNPVVAGLLFTILFSMSIGLGATGWFLNKSINDNHQIVQSQLQTQRLLLANNQALDSILGSFHRVNPENGGKSALKAHEVLDAAKRDIEGKFHAEPLTKGRLLSELGKAYESLGLSTEGVKCHQLSLDLFDQFAGPLSTVTIGQLQGLAKAQMKAGQLSDCLESHNELLSRARNDIEHAEKIANASELALLELQLLSGNALESIDALAASSKDFENEESQLRLQLLTEAYRGKGSSQKAIAVSKSFWEYRETNNGASAFETLMAKRQYVLALTDAGHFVNALPLSKSLLGSLNRVAGRESVVALEQREQYGWLLLNAGKGKRANTVATNALTLGAERYGPAHPIVLSLKRLKANCLRNEDRLNQAVQTLCEALASNKEHSESLSPASWKVVVDLSAFYRSQGRPELAVELLEPYLPVLGEFNSVESHEVTLARGELIRAYSESGDSLSAIPLAKFRFRSFEQRTRFEGVFVRFAKLDLIHMLIQANKYDLAAIEAKDLIEHSNDENVENSVFAGVSGKPVLKAKCLLAVSLAETGDFEAADQAARDAMNDPHLIEPYNHLMLCVRGSVLSNSGYHADAATMRGMASGILARSVFPKAEFNMRHLILTVVETIHRQAELEGNTDHAEFSKAAIEDFREQMYGRK